MTALHKLYLGRNSGERIDDIGQHYALESSELARRAVQTLIALLDEIKSGAEQGQPVRGMPPDHRKAQAIPFPYWIVYRVDPLLQEGYVVDIRHSKQRVVKPKAARRAEREPVQPALVLPERIEQK
ncbi:MAG: type II toxin-antitoxin system RelE/ParE family toxin [Phormidesmis sp.]